MAVTGMDVTILDNNLKRIGTEKTERSRKTSSSELSF